MTVSAVVALAGAVVGVLAIRAKSKQPVSVEASEAVANPGGSAVAAEEALEAAEVAPALAAAHGRVA
jgi:hypothetical protein